MSLQPTTGYPYALMPPTLKVRSTAVTVIALLTMLGGILSLVVAVIGLSLGGMAALAGFINGAAGGLAVAAMLILLTYALGSVAVGVGLWQLKEWAWPWTIVYEALSLNILIILILVGSPNWISALIGVAVSVAVIYVLYRPSVQAQFNRP
ncbi:MAG: hypothetical protein KIS91_09710 [Anaerolineae bacterium]|nr:hypothetical protein [Anaerolineae bacterium]